MIIHHQNNVAAFAGNHIWYWPLQPVVQLRARVGAPSDLDNTLGGLISTGGLVGAPWNELVSGGLVRSA